MMNYIADKQNELIQLQRQSAQRELYSSAKVVYNIQLMLNVFAPIICSCISLWKNNFTIYAAAIGTFTVLLDIFLLERLIKIKKGKAAKIQEMFDCDVLEMPKSPLKIVSDVAVEEILQHYDAHSKVSSNIERIKDWYPKAVSEIPLHIARLICQRANCVWDSKLRNKYLNILVIINIIAIVGIVTAGIILNITFLDFILIANALVPLFQFSVKQFHDNRDSISRLKELIDYAEKTWEEAINGKQVKEVLENSRRLQDEIYNHRSQNPLIPDFIYKHFRDKDEILLNKSAAILIAEYKSKNIS